MLISYTIAIKTIRAAQYDLTIQRWVVAQSVCHYQRRWIMFYEGSSFILDNIFYLFLTGYSWYSRLGVTVICSKLLYPTNFPILFKLLVSIYLMIINVRWLNNYSEKKTSAEAEISATCLKNQNPLLTLFFINTLMSQPPIDKLHFILHCYSQKYKENFIAYRKHFMPDYDSLNEYLPKELK